MKAVDLGPETSPGLLIYQQDLRRSHLQPPRSASSLQPPSTLLQQIRNSIPRISPVDDILPLFRRRLTPLPQPSTKSTLYDELSPPDITTEEEVAWWGRKVVWSKGNTVFRTYTYDQEGETVSYAMFAYFKDETGMEDPYSTEDGSGRINTEIPTKGREEKPKSQNQKSVRPKGLHPNAPGMGQVPSNSSTGSFGPFATSYGAQWTQRQPNSDPSSSSSSSSSLSTNNETQSKRPQRCLVVFLQTLAFFYFSSGETKVTSLPRPVEEAWALEEGGIVVSMTSSGSKTQTDSLQSNRKGKGRDFGMGTGMLTRDIDKTIDDLMEDVLERDEDGVTYRGSLCSLTNPRDRFRPLAISTSLHLRPPTQQDHRNRIYRAELMNESESNLSDFLSSSKTLLVTPELVGLLVIHDTSRQQLIFYRYGQRETALPFQLDDSHEGTLGKESLQTIPDPANRDIRLSGAPGRHSLGGAGARRSLSGTGAGIDRRESIGRPRMSAGGGGAMRQIPGARVLTQVSAEDAMDMTMTLGISLGQRKISPRIICEEVYRWDLDQHGAPVESIKAFLSSGPTTTSQKSQHYVNIHITSSQSALYTFPVEVSRSETTVHHQVSSPSMMPCAGAQPVSTLHFERTEVVVLSSDKTAVGIMYGQDSLIQVATPAVLELGKVLGEWNGDKDRVLATKLSDPCGSNLTVVLNNSRSYRMDLHQNPRSRLLRQALVAIEKRLPRDIVHHMRELVLGSQARSPSEISLVLEGVSGVVAPRTVIASENLSADASDELAAFLRSCDEPDLRKAASTIARKENPAESTVEGNLHPAGAFALLSILHLIAQDCLLDTGRNADVVVLVPVVCRLAENLGLSAWRDFWWRLFPKLSLIESKPSPTIPNPTQNIPPPPDIFDMLTILLQSGDLTPWQALGDMDAFPAIENIYRIMSNMAKNVEVDDLRLRRANRTLDAMVDDRAWRRKLQSLPWAVALPTLEAMRILRGKAKPSYGLKRLRMLDRKDLIAQNHGGARIVRNDARNMEQKEVMNAPATVYIDSVKFDLKPVVGGSPSTDHAMLTNYQRQEEEKSLPNFRFVIDRRLEDVYRLLQTQSARLIKAEPKHELNDAQRLEHDEKVVTHHAQRVLSRLLGQAILSYASQDVTGNSAFALPGFELGIRLSPSMELRLPHYAKLHSDVTGWPSFHNGVIGGLSIRPDCSNITSSWIAANRSLFAMSEFGGFLFGLGLSGHLRSLAKDHVFDWLALRHDQTSVGLILGMAVSFAGSQSESVTSVLSMGLPCLLPTGSLELNTSPSIQAASLLGVGLIYAGSGKGRMATVALTEIGRQLLAGIEPLPEYREAYSFSAACAFGLIMLGRGGQNPISDAQHVARLRAFCDASQGVGGGGGFADDIEHEITAPGATLALGLMFLKTDRTDISALIPLPEDFFALDQIRPDLLFIRTLARNLIHWSKIEPTLAWLESQVPQFILKAWKNRKEELPPGPIELGYIYIMSGACLAMGIRFAGTLNDTAYRVLHAQVKAFTDSHGGPITYEVKTRRLALKQAQYLTAISLSLVVAGSGDLAAYRRIRYLLGTEVGNFAWRTGMNMAVGLLFLGTGRYTLGSSNMSIAAMCIAFFPRFAMMADSNGAYLQACRHLWAMAVEPRCLITSEIGTLRTVYMPLKVDSKPEPGSETAGGVTTATTPSRSLTVPTPAPPAKPKTAISPALLSTYDTLNSVSAGSVRYHPLTITLGSSSSSTRSPNNTTPNPLIRSQTMFVKRRSAYLDYIVDPKGHRTLHMLTGPLSGNSVDGLTGSGSGGWDGGKVAVSPDWRDLVELVGEHEEDVFINGMVRRMSSLRLSEAGAEGEGEEAEGAHGQGIGGRSMTTKGHKDKIRGQGTDSAIWDQIILRCLLLDRVSFLPFEFITALSLTSITHSSNGNTNNDHRNSTSFNFSLFNLRLLRFARDYYSPQIYWKRFNMDNAKNLEPLMRMEVGQGVMRRVEKALSGLVTDDGSDVDGTGMVRTVESLMKDYFAGVSRGNMTSDTKTITDTRKQTYLATYLSLFNVPSLQTLQFIHAQLQHLNSQLLFNIQTQSYDTRYQILKWAAKKMIAEMNGVVFGASVPGIGTGEVPMTSGMLPEKERGKVGERGWTQGSLEIALRTWFPIPGPV